MKFEEKKSETNDEFWMQRIYMKILMMNYFVCMYYVFSFVMSMSS